MTINTYRYCILLTIAIWFTALMWVWYQWLPKMYQAEAYLSMFMLVWSGTSAMTFLCVKMARLYFIKAMGVYGYIMYQYPLEILDFIRIYGSEEFEDGPKDSC